MSFRDTINNNPAVGLIIAVVVVGVAIFVLRGNARPADNPQAYFYDLETGQLFAGLKTDVPPIDAPSGAGNGVQATVMSCGSCDNPDERFVAWISRFDPQVQDMVRRMNESANPVDADGNPIDVMYVNSHAYIAVAPESAGGEVDWISINAPQAQTIRQAPYDKCAQGTVVKTCIPE